MVRGAGRKEQHLWRGGGVRGTMREVERMDQCARGGTDDGEVRETGRRVAATNESESEGEGGRLRLESE